MDKNKCNSCGETKCSCKNKDFTKAVIEIDNPEQITLMRKVVIPASMGDDTAVPPVVGKYHNVLLYYEANSKSYLYSSDGIPTQLVNGFTNYEEAINLPQINGVTLLGDKSAADLKLADAPMVITVAAGNTSWSGADTAEDVYNFFLNKGKVNIVFNGGENYAYEVTSAGYIPEEEKMMCTLTAATITAGETAEFDGNALVGTMTLYTADKAIDVGQIELQPKLYVTDFTGLDLNYNELSGVPATNAAIGMVKPGDGLEVASDGTLSISDIEQYAHFFDTVADMKAATNLVAGDYAKTLGYYSLNDEGGAYYKISSTAPSGYYETLTGGLYAELILEDVMNVKQFGAKGDGINDDTAAIQTALDYNSNISVPSGTYMVDATTYLLPNSNNKIILNNDAKLKAITNNLNTSYVIYIHDVNNVEICGGTIEGERETHTGTTGEWGHCIYVNGSCDNIYIHDIKLTNAWGDGMCCNITGAMRTARVHVDNARRNGYSITMADSFISINDIIENTHGTNPQCGVDIEPNNASDVCREIIFDNLYTKNNAAYGFIAALIGGNGTNNFTNIKVNNMRSQGDNRGIGVRPGAGRLGEITFNEPVITNSTLNGILIDTSSTCRINIIRPIVKYYGCNAAGDTGIYLQGTVPSGVDSIGNIWVYEPVVTNPVEAEGITTSWAIEARSTLQDVHIINPVDLDNRLIRASFNEKCIIIDNNRLTSYAGNGNYTISRDNFRIYNYGHSFTANHNVTMREDQSFPIGTTVNFVNDGDYQMVVEFPGKYIYPISSTTGTNVILTNKGASITIERISNDAWTILNQNGTITSS